MKRLVYSVQEGVHSIFSHGLASFATVCIIFACLLVMGTFATVALNVNDIIGGLEDEMQIVAFVDESVPEQTARALETRIMDIDNVATATFVTKAEALENYLSQLRQSSLFDDLEPEVLRDRYLITMKDISIMVGTQHDLADIPGIALVNAHPGIASGMLATRRIVNIVSIVMIVLLLVVSLMMMANTLRLTAYTRRKEVALAKMIGATKAFIRGPFNVEGVILGLSGSLLAFLAEWALYSLLAEKLSASSLSFLHIIPFSELTLPVVVSFAAVGLLVAIFGSRIAIRNYMRV